MNLRQATVHPRAWLAAGCAAGIADLGTSVQWAVARRRRGIVGCGVIRAAETGSADQAALVRSAVAAARAHRPAVFVAVVPGTQAPVRPMAPTLRDVRRLRPTLDHLLEPRLPFDLADVATDHVITLQGAAVDGDVLSIACPRSESERILAGWTSAEAAPSLLDHEGIALFNLARSLWAATGPWCLLAVGEGRLGWVFGRDDRLAACRFVRVADPASALADWERAARTTALLSDWRATDANCRVVGPSQARDAWRAPLRDRLGFEPGPLSANEGLLEAAAAAGAALRGCGAGLGIDLMGVPIKHREAARPMMRSAWAAVALAAAVAFVPLVGRYARAAHEAARLRQVDRALLDIADAAGIPAPPPKQEVYALRRKLDRLHEELLPCVPLVASPTAQRLDELLQAAPPDMRFERIQMTPTSVVARVRAPAPGAALAFEAALARPGRAIEIQRLPAEGSASRIEVSLGERSPLP